MNKGGVFSISLDFELHWGCFETMRLLDENAQQYFSNTRKAIPEMLRLFEQYEIHVTWASVGMLFCNNKTEWMQRKPGIIPTFQNEHVSAYEWINKNGFQSEDDPCHFAPQLIEKIKATRYQEIGTHTYAHYFCLEPGQTKEQFREDMHKACEIAKEKGIAIRSLVFPRNQFNEEYLSVCNEVGVTSVRSSPDIWYWSPATGSSFMKKFFRAGDAYVKFQPIKMVYLEDIDTNTRPLQLPATRLYRPWKPGQSVQNKLKMRRILREMTEVARKAAYYHLWWHPHNFGNHPQECLRELEIILQHFKKLQISYGLRSLTMQETTDELIGIQS
jgi:peptidoglycan/xylan/chitin deacetylase (PgdA/CDA1 family)